MIRTKWRAVIAVALLALVVPGGVRADDHRDGPGFNRAGCVNRRDIGSLYAFRSPANANNTVLIMTVSPFAGASSPATFATKNFYEIEVSPHVAYASPQVFRVKFGPVQQGVQIVTLRSTQDGVTQDLATGATGQNIPITGGGTFRAAMQDDPAFFDAVGINSLLNGGAFPRAPGVAANFVGPDANILAIVIEIPSSRLGANNDLVAVWGRTRSTRGGQIDRVGRPLINTLLIPPIPRGPNVPNPGPELRDDFNKGNPATDRLRFKNHVISVLTTFYGRAPDASTTLANQLLPDVLQFQLGNPNGFGTLIGPGSTIFGNGRRLRDDGTDILLLILSGGVLDDNVADDNGTKITDGNMGTVAAFPYIGPANGTPTPLPGPACRR